VKKLHQSLREKERQVRKALRELEASGERPIDQTTFAKGDPVRILSLDKEGEISELVSGSRAKVKVGNVITTVELRNLQKIDRRLKPKEVNAVSGVEADSEISPEIHLRGMTAEEGIEALERFLDRAVVAGLRQIYVIHGKGTGRLRRALTAFLKQHSEVDSIRLGNWNEGGAGVTIVKLKE
jgi:DNA mismatch repair protein MutS2